MPSRSEHLGPIGLIRRQWPWVLVAGIVAAGVILILLGDWRIGAIVIGGAIILGGILRWFMADPGILALRRMGFDVVFYLLLGVGIVVAALIVDDPII